ncbi:MAG: TatD family hydrolase [Rikenellaceae bacterium]
MIDTHSHIYDEAFDEDIAQVIERAQIFGVKKILLPAVDSTSHERLGDLCAKYPDFCVPMMGVHPTSLTAGNLAQELEIVRVNLSKGGYIAVGEVGLDLYWSKEFLAEQITALKEQISLALSYDLPLVFHVRDAWEQMLDLLEEYADKGLRGVMHSFSGDAQIYNRVKSLGEFVFGIGGVVTFKNSGLDKVVNQMNINDLVLETDAPYLTPVPYRGKRNESSYVRLVAEKIAEIKGMSVDEVIKATSENARRIFRLEEF